MSNRTENGSFREFGDKLTTKTKKSKCLFTINSRKKTKSPMEKQQQ